MKYVGLWLDHKKAVVVKLDKNKETTEKKFSKLSPLDKTRHISRVAPKKHEERREHIISKFYNDVLKMIRTTDKVFLMGPGIAKKEFKIFLKQQRFLGKVQMSNADKMTDRQVAAQTRDFFGLGTH